MTRLISILISLLILSVLVMIHELGHYLVGRLLKFRIKGFSIGMGPALVQKQYGETVFAVRAFPIGGMCQFVGEDEENVPEGEGFNDHPVWKRFLVVLAGPVMNLLLAVLLSVAALSVYGNYMPEIHEILADTPASRSELQPEDIVTAVNGKKVTFYSDVFDMITDCRTDDILLTVWRGSGTATVRIKDIYDAEKQGNFLGVTIAPVRLPYSVPRAFAGAFSYVGYIVRQTFAFFGALFTGQAQSTDVAGPVGTIAVMSEAVQYGFEVILQLAIMISISLGIMNLLPIPALDGGRILFYIIEGITGKPFDRRKEGIVHMIGFILLMALIVFLTFNDITNLINGSILP